MLVKFSELRVLLERTEGEYAAFETDIFSMPAKKIQQNYYQSFMLFSMGKKMKSSRNHIAPPFDSARQDEFLFN